MSVKERQHWGRYDGTYAPSASPAPADNSTWVVYLGSANTISPNVPTEGTAEFVDPGTDAGERFSLEHLPGNESAKLSDLSEQEWEYEFSVQMIESGGTLVYNTGMAVLSAGFMHEGGDEGKSIRLGLFEDTVSGERFVSFTCPRTAGAIATVNYFDWLDKNPHTYTVKKYRSPGSEQFEIQVLINGVPQLNPPIPHESFPVGGKGNTNFSFGTPSSKTCRVHVQEIQYGPLSAIPARASVDKIELKKEKPSLRVPLPQESGDSGTWRIVSSKPEGMTSGEMELQPNRHYNVSGRYSVEGDIKQIGIQFEQYSPSFRQAAIPVHKKHLEIPEVGKTVDFEFPVYLKMENSLATLRASATGKGSVNFTELTISGGGPYRPQTQLFPQERSVFTESEILKNLERRGGGFGSIEFREGIPVVVADGDFPPLFYAGPMVSQENLGAWGMFGKVGVHLQAGHVSPGSMGVARWWTGKESYDFSMVDRLIRTILSRDADARVILNVWVDPYPAWGTEHPEEVVWNSQGEYAIGMNHLSRWGKDPGTSRLLPSLFSKRSANDIGSALAALENWLNHNKIGGAVVGYYLWGFNDGNFGNWVHPATSRSENDELGDYSPAALHAWREWLRTKYEGSIENLQASWSDPSIESFDAIEIPTVAERQRQASDSAPWLLNSKFNKLVDFNKFYGQAPAGNLERIIAAFRSEAQPKRFIMSMAGNAMHGWRGYTGFGSLIDSGQLDAVLATSDYNVRMPGYSGGSNSFPASLALRRMVFFHEFDYRSYCAPSEFENMDFGCGRANTDAEHRSMLLREAANMIAQGQGMYFLDMMGNWYGDPALMKGVSDTLSLFSLQSSMRYEPRADAAIFVGEDSINYLEESDEASRFLIRSTKRQRPEWDTSGVPYHLYLQEDITNPELPDYRVYLFVLPQKMTAKERSAIDNLKRDGKTLLFLHAPDICDSADPEKSISKITGIRVRRHTGSLLAGRWLENENPLLEGLSGTFGDRPIPWKFMDRPSRGLSFFIDDAKATPLATFKNSEHVAAAVRDFGTWRSVYIAIPWIDSGFLQNLARTSDAWTVANPGDAVFANQNFIGIHATHGGTKRLRPLRTSRITDALTGEVIADRASEFNVEMSFGETRIFRCEESPLPLWERLFQILPFR